MNNKLETRDDCRFIGDKKVLAGWESFSGWYWFGVEKTATQDSVLGNDQVVLDDQIWFGFVQGLEEEWGYFSQGELESLGKYKVWRIKAVDLPYAGRREQKQYIPQVKQKGRNRSQEDYREGQS